MDLKTFLGFFHQLATVVWIGGMVYYVFILTPSLKVLDPPQRGKLNATVGKKFAIVAWLCILTLVITGILIAPNESNLNLHPNYDLIFSIKIVLFILILIIGITISTVLLPKIKNLAPKPGEKPAAGFLKAQKQVSFLAVVNLIIGILIILIFSFR